MKDYRKYANASYVVETEKLEGVNNDNMELKTTKPSQLGAFVLSSLKKILNKFTRVIDGYGTNPIWYQGTHSLHIEKKHRVKVNVADLVGKYLCRGKEGYEVGGIFYGFLLAPKNQNLFEFVRVRYCCTAQYVKMFHAYEKTIRQKKVF